MKKHFLRIALMALLGVLCTSGAIIKQTARISKEVHAEVTSVTPDSNGNFSNGWSFSGSGTSSDKGWKITAASTISSAVAYEEIYKVDVEFYGKNSETKVSLSIGDETIINKQTVTTSGTLGYGWVSKTNPISVAPSKYGVITVSIDKPSRDKTISFATQEFCVVGITVYCKNIIKYNANGGSGTMDNSLSEDAETYPSVANNSFTRTGYSFVGWNTKADGTGEAWSVGSITSSQLVTLFAQWEANDQSVTNTLTHCTSNNKDLTAKYDGSYTTIITPETGYHLPSDVTVTNGTKNWNSKTGVLNITNIHGDINYKVDCIINTYTITFMNGDSVVETISVEYGQVPTYTGSALTKKSDNNYVYMWDSADGWQEEIVAATKDATYHAKFSTSENIDYILSVFVGEKLHFNDVSTDEVGIGKCVTENYYSTAKAMFNSLSKAAKEEFMFGEDYAEARERFRSWATANGEQVDFSLPSYLISIRGDYVVYEEQVSEQQHETLIVMGITFIAAISLGGFLIYKKRKEC